MKKPSLVFTLLLCGLATSVAAKHHSSSIKVTEFTTDVESPWGLAFLPSGESLLTQRSGELIKLSSSGEKLGAVTGLPKAEVKGQGGMLGITIHPNFDQNQFVYVCLNVAGKGGAGSEVHRGKLSGLTLSNVKPIFIAQPKADSGFHFGCRLNFDEQQNLYISLGDRGVGKEQAQDTSVHYGKVIRVSDDGGIPPSNPFVGKKGSDAVFTYGHRNVQGMAKHPTTGDIWTHEHGPKGGDEINILSAGDNYGWPLITYGVNYNGTPITDKTAMQGMRQPLTYWDPSIAPSGMTFYTGDEFPEWQGNLFIGSLKFRHLRRLELSDSNEVTAQHELLLDRNERIRDVVQGLDGKLYVLTDSVNGKILQLSKH